MSTDDHAENVRKTVALLWRRGDDAARPGPRQRTTVHDVVAAAVRLADDHGLAQLSMRALAERVGLRPMGLYTYVPNREVLIALMVDAVALDDRPIPSTSDLTGCLRAIADQYREEMLRHPWLAEVPAWRSVPGPGSSQRYERQLAAVVDAGSAVGREFDDVELDAIVAALRAFATGNARLRIDQNAQYEGSGLTDAQWWEVAGPLLAGSMSSHDYPVSSRVGSTVGELFAGPGNADHAYRFGLDRLIEGIVGTAMSTSGHFQE